MAKNLTQSQVAALLVSLRIPQTRATSMAAWLLARVDIVPKKPPPAKK